MSAPGFRSACGRRTRGPGPAAARGGGCGVRWESGLGSGSGNLLSPLSSSQFSAASPLFPFVGPRGATPGRGGVIDVSLAPCSAAGSDHAAVADRDPLAKEHQGACHAGLCHPGVRPRDPETFLPPHPLNAEKPNFLLPAPPSFPQLTTPLAFSPLPPQEATPDPRAGAAPGGARGQTLRRLLCLFPGLGRVSPKRPRWEGLLRGPPASCQGDC